MGLLDDMSFSKPRISSLGNIPGKLESKYFLLFHIDQNVLKKKFAENDENYFLE